MTIIIRAELRARADAREEFVDAARALAAVASDEDGTLRYLWYRSEDPSLFVVIEEYTDPDAAIAHNQRCEALLRRIAKLGEMTSVHLHGDIGPALKAWVADRPVAHAHPPLLA